MTICDILGPPRRAFRPKLSQMIMAMLGIAVAGLLLPPSAASAATEPARGVVLVGVAGLQWSDVDEASTPTLFDLVAENTAGSVAVRSVAFATCASDGWLTVGAGQRAIQDRGEPVRDVGSCLPTPAPAPGPDAPITGEADNGVTPATIPGWRELVDTQDDAPYDSKLGQVGQALSDGDGCATAVGPGAALALANETGRVARYLANADGLSRDIIRDCAVTVVDLGDLPNPADAVARQAAVRMLDARLAAVRERVPDDTALLVAGISDSGVTQPVPAEGEIPPESRIAPIGLRVGLAAGPQPDGLAFGRSWLTSSSTRWDGLVILADLSPTLLAYAGLPKPDTMVGHAWASDGPHPASATNTLEQLVGASTAADVFRSQSGPFFQYLGLVELAFFGLAFYLLGRPLGHQPRRIVLRVLGIFALTAASFPVASFLANLVPWWLADRPALLLWPLILGIALGIALVAAYGPWRSRAYGPTGVVAGATFVVLGADVLTGSTLQHSSLLGLSPLTAGRFYGFGNIAYAVFVTAALVLAGALAQAVLHRRASTAGPPPTRPAAAETGPESADDEAAAAGRTARRRAFWIVVVIGLVTIALDGAPFAGADFGGVIASVCGFSLLALAVAESRPSWLRLVGIAVGAAVLVSAIAFFDWLRPAAERTHLGEFVQQVFDGEAGTVVWRKGTNALRTFDRPFYGWLVPLAYALIISMVKAPERMHVPGLAVVFRQWPLLRPLIWAGLVTGAVGFAANDSGVIVPALMLTVGIPLVVAAVARAHRLALDASPAPPAATGPTPPSRSPTRH